MTPTPLQRNEKMLAEIIFQKLHLDISDRRGLKRNWGTYLDDEIQQEIKDKWIGIFSDALATQRQEVLARVVGLVEEHFNGLIHIPAPHLTKESLLTRIKNEI